MAQRWGQAIVVGAGIGGLLFARVLADWCTRVLVLERDSLPQDSEVRAGVPQGRHLHALLAGGCRAMQVLLPGLVEEIREAGAVEATVGWTTRMEIPGHDPMPRRDLGFSQYSLSRPLLELCVRRRVQALGNVVIHAKAAVEQFLHDGVGVNGVRLHDGRIMHADLVVDASGRGELTQRVLDAMGMERPRQTVIGVDMNYASALFEIPSAAAYEWTAVITSPNALPDSRGALLATIEGRRWLCALGWRGEQPAPMDRESYLEWAHQLRTHTVYDALKDAPMLGKVMRQVFTESCYRHYAQLESWPRGLLAVADAICRFNPIYGQGMSVAALEAETFAQLLADDSAAELHDLVRCFLRRCDQIIEAPWNLAALPDLAHPDTRGERPADLMTSLRLNRAFAELAARDAGVHKLMMEIRGLLKPRSALTADAALLQRVYEVMAEQALSAAAN